MSYYMFGEEYLLMAQSSILQCLQFGCDVSSIGNSSHHVVLKNSCVLFVKQKLTAVNPLVDLSHTHTNLYSLSNVSHIKADGHE